MKFLNLAFFGSMLMFVSCSKDQSSDPIVAQVNGEKIFKSTLLGFFPPHNRLDDISQYFENLREKAIDIELVHQKAIKEMKADDTELLTDLENIKEHLVFNKYRQRLLKEALSDKNLKAQYEKFIKDNPAEAEVRARHILVDSEDLAKTILSDLEKGGSFEELSQKHSKDKGANAQKGDLGYFRASDMVKPFSEKAFDLRSKMIDKLGRDHFHESMGLRDIVQTQFGWHIIEVLGSRESSHPPLAELKGQLEAEITRDVLEKESDRLKEKAKIEIVPLPKESEIKDPILVKIDGREYKKSDLLKLIPNAEPDMDLTDLYDRLTSEFVKRRLITAEAIKAISINDKDIQSELSSAQKRIMVHLFLDRYVKSQLNDAKLQEEYKIWLSKNKPEDEVHARHILVNTEEEAKEILNKLNEGADFTQMANEKSKDKGAKGGDLGYFTTGVMVPEFSQMAFSLKPGQNGQKGEMGIVKSNFGWHIIEVLDKRQTKIPSFEEIKPELENEQAQTIVDTYLDMLKKDAKIELFDLPKAEAKGKTSAEKVEAPALPDTKEAK